MFSAGEAGVITASFGVATFPREGADEESLLALVERALSQARQLGPNCVHTLERAA